MLKRATAVLIPAIALVACSSAGDFEAEMPDFSPTKDGAELEIGDTAKVETVDFGHKVPVQWEVTVGQPERIDAPRKAKQAAEFICFPVTFTPVAVGAFKSDVTVALPELLPIDGDLEANRADPDYCGESTLTGYTPELQVGEEYTTYVASWEGTADPGIQGTGVELSTPDVTITWR